MDIKIIHDLAQKLWNAEKVLQSVDKGLFELSIAGSGGTRTLTFAANAENQIEFAHEFAKILAKYKDSLERKIKHEVSK